MMRITEKKFAECVSYIAGMRFHSGLDFSEEISSETIESTVSELLNILDIEVI